MLGLIKVEGQAVAVDSSPFAWARVYCVANRRLRVCANDEGVARWCERFIGDYCLTSVIAAPRDEVSGVVKIKVTEPRPALPTKLVWQEIVHGRCAVAGETIYLEIDDSLIVIGAPELHVVRVWMGKTPRALEPLSLATVMSYAVNAALRRCGRFELHAAAVVEPVSGQGALIIGDSGSGKSTLTMGLMASGWLYLSDDRLLLGATADQISAWAWRRVFSLTEDTLERCAAPRLNEALRGRAIDDPGKQHVEPRVLFPDRFVSSCRPRALFFTRLTGQAESRVVALTPAEAMVGLLRQCPWTCYDPAAARVQAQVLARLVEQCRSYQLLTGRDLWVEPQRAAALFAACLNSTNL